jgi:hypothetical protein
MAKIAENAINSALSCLYALMTKMAVFYPGDWEQAISASMITPINHNI